MLRVVFMGTPDFAVPCLDSIVKAGYDVCGVFTQPDKPKGRGYTLTPPDVKVCALKHGLKVYQPEKMKDGTALKVLKELNPDVIVVVAYGKILPEDILNLPKYGCINVHGSLLPKYRGAAPIQWSVINGEKKTGVTTMYMDVGLDTGDMLFKSETDIGENETSGELYSRLSEMGADLIVKTLKAIESGDIKRVKQNDSESTYSPMLQKSLSFIDWNKSAQEVHNLVRGLNPWPTACTKLNGKNLKVHTSRLSNLKANNAGEVISSSPLVVGCGDGNSLELVEIQYEGKKRMFAADFCRGHKIEIGTKLGHKEEN